MDKILTPDVQNLDASEGSRSLIFELLEHHPSLQTLLSHLSVGLKGLVDDYLLEPCGLDQFEMLEAELCNQRILSNAPSGQFYNLSQLASNEAGFWRWKARRHGLASVPIEVSVDIPRYLCQRALRLLALLHPEFGQEILNAQTPIQTERDLNEDARNPIQELRYLESFASYLLGDFSAAENQFQHGLNLLLKSLAFTRSAARAVNRSAQRESYQIALPLDGRGFVENVLKFKASS